MNKRYLNELNNAELKQVFDNNREIRQEVFEIIDNDNYLLIENDYCSHFRHYDKNAGREKYDANFEWDAWDNITITVNENNYGAFLEDCKKIINYNGCLSENKALIDRLSEKIGFFDDCLNNYADITNKTWENLSHWVYTGIEALIDGLEKEVQNIQDSVFDDDYLFSYFSDEIYLEDTQKYVLGDDLSTVYQDITRKYA